MNSEWKKFVYKYNIQETYWYVHQRDFNDAEALLILETFEKYQGKTWNKSIQSKIRNELLKENIIDPRKKNNKEGNANAIIRGVITVLTTYGLAYWDKKTNIALTPVGKKFLENGNFVKLKENQMWKYLIYNPTFKENKFNKVKIVPHAMLVKILGQLSHVTMDEYVLFVSRSEKFSQDKDVIDLINKWRNESKKTQKSILDRLQREKISVKGSSMYEKIKRNSTYSTNLFANNFDYLKKYDQKIKLTNSEKANHLFEKFEQNFEYIRFIKKQDWMEFYGDHTRSLTKEEALEYVEAKGFATGQNKFKEEAKRIFALNPNLIKSFSEEEYEKNYEDEIHIHKIYKNEPGAIENGLKLVKGEEFNNGFKWRIPEYGVGEVDLFCKDKNDNYVVVELKKRKGSDKTIGQILRYIGWVKRNICKNTEKVRGIIISREYDEKIKYAAGAVGSLLKYKKTNIQNIGTQEIGF